MIDWLKVGPTVLASFMASMVEFVEALTVVLAVGTVRGFRSALMGTAVALAALVLAVAVFGSSLARISLPLVQLLIGMLTLLFGLRWLRKAILRSAGVLPLHDETAEYLAQQTRLRRGSPTTGNRWDSEAFGTAFKIVMMEGIEVVFIVIAIAANGSLLWAASLGAVAALLLVMGLGLWLHRPLANIPENALKFAVGLLLTAFGTFWVGESLQLKWPHGDLDMVLLVAAYFGVARGFVSWCRVRKQRG